MPPSGRSPSGPRRRNFIFGHDDALNARKAGEIVPLKKALAAVPRDKGTIIEVKLFNYAARAVYRIKVRSPEGVISTYRVDARTGLLKSFF